MVLLELVQNRPMRYWKMLWHQVTWTADACRNPIRCKTPRSLSQLKATKASRGASRQSQTWFLSVLSRSKYCSCCEFWIFVLHFTQGAVLVGWFWITFHVQMPRQVTLAICGLRSWNTLACEMLVSSAPGSDSTKTPMSMLHFIMSLMRKQCPDRRQLQPCCYDRQWPSYWQDTQPSGGGIQAHSPSQSGAPTRNVLTEVVQKMFTTGCSICPTTRKGAMLDQLVDQHLRVFREI